jgi:DNA-binding CsgD family transcriptional regulator
MTETESQNGMVATMTQTSSRFNSQPSPSRLNIAAEKLSRLQAELASEARRRAVDDVGAAMAHQLNEPLTALLLHLHAIKQAGARSDGAEIVPASICEIVNMALREAERACEIVDRAGRSVQTPADAETAVARGPEVIESCKRNGHVSAVRSVSPASSPVVGQHALTPREHQVLALITAGASNKEGGHRLGISTRTFEAHRAHLMGKLGTRNAADLVRVALATFSHAPLISVEDQTNASDVER